MRVDLDMLDSQILTLMINYVTANLSKPRLTTKNFTTTKSNPSDSELPSIYLKQLPSIETATDLENDEFRGGLFTYEVKVTSNVSQTEVKNIMNVVTRAMKSMGFNGTSLPVYADTDNLHVKIARWQREFDDGDTI